MEIDRDTLDLFAYRVEMHGIHSAVEISTARYGDDATHALLDAWYGRSSCDDNVVQSDRNAAAMADARLRRAAGF